MLARAPLARPAARASTPARARRASTRARVARASRAADADADAARARAIVGCVVTVALATTLATASAARAEVTCDMITPCTPPPPNGEPRYKLPGSTYDPAKAATARFEAALRGATTTEAPAPTFGDDARRGEATK